MIYFHTLLYVFFCRTFENIKVFFSLLECIDVFKLSAGYIGKIFIYAAC